ncbi:MAG: thiol reductant ABC exporter subunit CydD [Candidatus Nanopelagicales bacterium]
MVAAILIGAATGVLLIAQAFAITDIVVPVFLDGASLGEVRGAIYLLVGAIIGRVAMSYLTESLAYRAAAQAKSQLRLGVVEHVEALGPVWRSGRNSAALTQLVTRGIDGLDSYFARYLPQLVLAVIVPLTVGVVVLLADPLAALIVVLTLPLIPVFMILIGKFTQSKVDRQWRTLSQLSGHFVDVVAGMPTLKAFGRANAQARNVQQIGEKYRTTTMGVLRISFLSSLVLEVLAMLSVAIVAVSIGIRLVDGTMTLHAGLLVLILVPEIYLPLRLVGMHFHAAAEGLGAAGDMIEILETPTARSGAVTDVPDLSAATVVFDEVSVTYPGRATPAVDALSFRILPRSITALVGPSGAGKSTAVSILERFVDPSAGRVAVESKGASIDLGDFDVDAWRSHVCWIGQDPQLVSDTVAANVALGDQSADPVRVAAALAAVGLTELVASLDAGPQTLVGEGGKRVSVGQARRIALARAFYQRAELVLLDEPTAALDGETEAAVLTAIDELAQRATVLVVAHRDALIARADSVVQVVAPKTPSSSDDTLVRVG